MADGKKIFDGSSDEDDGERKHRRPVLENNSEGSAAWLHKDKNGNAYLSIRLPLGLGSLNLFPANDTMEDALNQLSQYLEEQDMDDEQG